jgi:hypothetical protein
MPDEGASMKDAKPEHPDERRIEAGVQQESRTKVQDERMHEYLTEERLDESETVVERADGAPKPESGPG